MSERPRARRAAAAENLLAVGGLFLFGVLLWWQALTTPAVLFDEHDYVQAFAARAAGESPYSVERFLYTPAFAAAGAAGVETLGEHTTLVVLRHLNLLGVCGSIWLSLGLTGWSPRTRLLLSALAVAAAPIVWHGMGYGNITFLVVALSLWGLALADARPLAGGAVLGLGLLVKPLAGPAALALGLHRPVAAPRRRALLAGMAAALVCGLPLLLVDGQRLPEMAARMAERYEAHYNLSLAYVLHCFGLDLPSFALAAAVVAATAVLALRSRLDPRRLVLLGSTASLLALPLVWTHTLAWTFPAQALAAERAIDAWHAAAEPVARRRARLHLLLVLAAIADLQGSAALVALPRWPDPVRGVFLALPLLLATGLALYAAGCAPTGSNR